MTLYDGINTRKMRSDHSGDEASNNAPWSTKFVKDVDPGPVLRLLTFADNGQPSQPRRFTPHRSSLLLPGQFGCAMFFQPPSQLSRQSSLPQCREISRCQSPQPPPSLTVSISPSARPSHRYQPATIARSSDHFSSQPFASPYYQSPRPASLRILTVRFSRRACRPLCISSSLRVQFTCRRRLPIVKPMWSTHNHIYSTGTVLHGQEHEKGRDRRTVKERQLSSPCQPHFSLPSLAHPSIYRKHPSGSPAASSGNEVPAFPARKSASPYNGFPVVPAFTASPNNQLPTSTPAFASNPTVRGFTS